MSEAGYYRFPTIHDDVVVFACEDDLWTVPATGGVARRLTSNSAQASTPALSPDGEWLAFTGRDEGQPEVYCMPAAGGPATRITFLGAMTRVVGWTVAGESIVFASNAGQPFARRYGLHAVSREGGEPRSLPTGPAVSISFGPDRAAVIGRNTSDLARWKRYRGGLTGDLWIDGDGDGVWHRLIQLEGNVATPLWVGDRIFFVSDHEAIGNLYSCLPTGDDLQRHTSHNTYYVRNPATDGRRIVYHAGADLYLYDPESNQSQQIGVDLRSPRVQRNRKFVHGAAYLQDFDLHPEGHSVAIISRGRPYTMASWEGAVVHHGEPEGVRYRLAAWLHDGERFVAVSDATGEERLEIHHGDASEEPERLGDLDIGRTRNLVVSPKKEQVALSNHRNELQLVDLDTRTLQVLDRSAHGPILGIAWAPDGRWVAYGFRDTQETSIIKLCKVETGETWAVTDAVLHDLRPAFDPEGKYLYFLSYREFDPVYDNLHFDLSFPWGMRPYLVTLRADLPSPFVPVPRAPGEKASDEDGGDDNAGEDDASAESSNADAADEADASGTASKADAADEADVVAIDVEGITDRVIAFPLDEGRYGQIRGMKGKVLYTTYPVEGSLRRRWYPGTAPSAKATLYAYDFEDQDDDELVEGISYFDLSLDGKTLIYRAGNRLRVVKAGAKPNDKAKGRTRKSGWLDLDRIKVSIEPQAEWEQMFREAWRLQRDHFWTEDMSGVDWHAVYERYLPLLERVASRAEFSDLMWEMQGELGTSHAYEYGGDYPPQPSYDQGYLGADLSYDADSDSWRVDHIVRGDVWDEEASSPLARPGASVSVGDRLLAINGRRVSWDVAPHELLVNQAGNEVVLTIADAETGTQRTVTVEALQDEMPARYREWVESNRRRVHEATDGRVGYVQIPDMGPHGFAEFHRAYLKEVGREGLIVDVRFNGGGHVSELILEKLARQRVGYGVQRWGQPIPYPRDSVLGPLVALTNEEAGSDGDIFSHVFKLLELGPLIGKRTWGGVIGISVRDSLVDSGITTQPEFSWWFEDVGWGVENYGTDPDIEVEYPPQDHAAGRDPQLERGIAEIQRLLEENPPELPNFTDRPKLGLPTLPEK